MIFSFTKEHLVQWLAVALKIFQENRNIQLLNHRKKTVHHYCLAFV